MVLQRRRNGFSWAGYSPSGFRFLWFLILAGGLWVAANPYIGIDHDARLYTFMALRWLTPSAYARDPWFAYGSQDDWSVFSPLYALVLERFGVEGGAMLTTVAGGVLFIIAAIVLARASLRGSPALLAALLLVAVPLGYSPKGMLFVSESFATARLFAVPLSMMAMALGLRGKLRGAFALHGAALLLHPSMALAPFAITLLASVKPRLNALLVVTGFLVGVCLLIAGALGLAPVIDGAWLMFVEPAVLVFIGPWIRAELAEVLVPILVLLIAHEHGCRRMRCLYGTGALVASACVWFSLIAGDWMPVRLVLQAQLWRGLWIAQVLAVLAFVDLAARFVVRRHARSRLPLLILLVPLASLASPGAALGAAWLALKLVSSARWERFKGVVYAHRYLARGFLGLVLATHVPAYLLSLSLASTSIDSSGDWTDLAIGFLRTGGYGALPVAACWLIYRVQSLVLAMLAAAFLALALLLWDGRSPLQKHWESRYSIDGSRRMFAQQIERGRTVYWHDSAPRVWLELGTAGYASTTHATGLVFSRERTRVLDARLTRVAIRGLDAEQVRLATEKGALLEAALRGSVSTTDDVRPYVLASYEARRSSTPFGIGFLCRDKDLDFVIDPVKADGMQVAEETEQIDGRRIVNYLYDCAQLRARLKNAKPVIPTQSTASNRAG